MANDAFEKFKKSVNRGITTISIKTSSSLEKSKIKLHIDSLEKDVQKMFATLGGEVYQIWQEGSMDFEGLSERIDEIRKKREEIEELFTQLNSIDDRDNEVLGIRQEAEEGTAPPLPTAQEITNRIICSNCGAEYENAVNFCRKCGQNLKQTDSE